MSISSLDTKQFRQALGSFTTGVTIVTTCGPDGNDYGLTANSFNSVSMDPPMVLWSINKESSSAPAFMGSDHFAVHILATDQESLSNRFAKSGADKFESLALERGFGDVPLLAGCSARFQCKTSYQYEGGDHIILVGEVMAFDRYDSAPLVFHGGGYRSLQPSPSGPSDAIYGDNWLGFLLGRAYYQLQLPIRRQLIDMGMRESDFELLAILSFSEGRSPAELNALFKFVGKTLSDEHLSLWVDKGLLAVDNERVQFTAEGRHLAIQWLSFAKAAEMSALEPLSYDESQQLKLLLGRVIHSTGADLPAHWRKENIWQENNIWKQQG
ncbi:MULTISPECIES: flavin reductase family protein [Halopseudomonas]|uniref:3-hydroxy-9,10-secoandrosta-1,3,5(10)-triene-9,17-dione monooxygenase reductase component n=1 Tax=Halopseudomonas aestusnigri TaxID=857252 RepID=A0AAQ1G9E2_9GAMM|nr:MULTISPECIES: flavin reductase family protein [Halopseudomonas]SEG53692.1 3-hydroxy-9,10-secoandrosta-1,3,5(10)-triene-9,17-dione monooxygenase reductase component [Halopseudomonas aestusnigri]